MKKNVIIVLLIAACVVLFGAYQTASKERSQLTETAAEYAKMKKDIQKFGEYLYQIAPDVYGSQRLMRDAYSFCDAQMYICAHVDNDGNLFITGSK